MTWSSVDGPVRGREIVIQTHAQPLVTFKVDQEPRRTKSRDDPRKPRKGARVLEGPSVLIHLLNRVGKLRETVLYNKKIERSW